MRRPRRLWVDIETYSTVDLRKVSPYRYVEDPEFLILMGSYATDYDREVRDLVGQEQFLNELGDWLDHEDVLKVAHNAPFERICFSTALGMPVGTYIDPEQFHDTQAVAGVKGYPQKLEKLAPALGAEPKDSAGTLLINWFCKPDRNGNRRMPEDYPEKWQQFIDYCNQDVVSLIGVDEALGDFPTEIERRVSWADQHVNDIGLPMDVPTIKLAAEAVAANAVDHERELSLITGLAKPNNPVTLREWLTTTPTHNGKRLRMSSLEAEVVENRLATLDRIGEPETPLRRALELRQELAGTASKKFAAALLGVSSDGRMRGSFRYFGAHTGRWSGKGAQPQNLPRHTFGPDADDLLTMDLMKELGTPKADIEAFEKKATDKVVDAALEQLDLLGRLSPDELKRLVRACFTGPSWGDEDDLTVVDYSSIEARVIAWLAGELWALKAFYAGRDIYVETAERMGGLTRAQGKIAVLALGYAGGVNSLRNMAGPNDDFINERSDEVIKDELVNPWRRANSKIVQLWADLDHAFGKPMRVGQHLYTTESEDKLGRAVHLHLPSGRAITYHGVEWERYVVRDKKTKKLIRKEGWRYANPKDPFNRRMRIGTYGGKLTENVTQAVARDVLAEALVRLVDKGFRPVGHVHDEILTEGSDLERIEKIMTQSPRWAKGLPIDGEGFVTRRYKKG